jgi:hypothetical protein
MFLSFMIKIFISRLMNIYKFILAYLPHMFNATDTYKKDVTNIQLWLY